MTLETWVERNHDPTHAVAFMLNITTAAIWFPPNLASRSNVPSQSDFPLE